MLIDVVIVTYFSAKEIQACLNSLLMQTLFPQCHVWIVDNASQDETVNIVKSFTSPNISLLCLPENIGFGCAINKATAGTKSNYIYLLNPDACLKTPHDLYDLISFAEQHPSAGVIGTRVIGAHGKETKPRQTYPKEKKMPTSLGILPGKWAWVIGASFLVRTFVFHEVKGFDPDFFLYGEEVDLCLRIRKHGFEVAFMPDVFVEHIGSASADQLPNYHKKTLKTQGLYLFLKKHYPLKEVRALAKHEMYCALFRYCLNYFFSKRKAEIYRAEKEALRKFLSQTTLAL